MIRDSECVPKKLIDLDHARRGGIGIGIQHNRITVLKTCSSYIPNISVHPLACLAFACERTQRIERNNLFFSSYIDQRVGHLFFLPLWKKTNGTEMMANKNQLAQKREARYRMKRETQ